MGDLKPFILNAGGVATLAVVCEVPEEMAVVSPIGQLHRSHGER